MKVLVWPFYSTDDPNDYVSIIYSALEDRGLEFTSTLPLNPFPRWHDTFHYHWPETYLNCEPFLKAAIGSALVLLKLFINRARGIKNIWTVHNLSPHENHHKILTKHTIKIIFSLSDELIFLSESSRNIASKNYNLDRKSSHIIPHPFYRESADSAPSWVTPEKYIIFFGRIRPYKNIPTLINTFINTESRKLSLLIIGSCEDKILLAEIQELAAKSDRVLIKNEYVPYENLIYLIKHSEGVVLPYTDITNSGSIFLSLTLDKKVLVPMNSTFQEIKDETNAENILFYENELNPKKLDTFLTDQAHTKIDHDLKKLHNKSIIDKYEKLFMAS